MKAICYYCNEELTEKTIEKHMETCAQMKKIINEEPLGYEAIRDVFLTDQFEYSKIFIDYEEHILNGLSNSGYSYSKKNAFKIGTNSFDIKELIGNMSKEHIYYIAKYLGMTKVSSLSKKDLIEKFVDNYKLLIESKLSLFDEERYKLLKKYSNNNGLNLVSKIKEDLNKISYFFKSGMFFPAEIDGAAVIVIPTVLKEIIQEKNTIEFRRLIKENSNIINIYRGINNAYGILNLKDLKKIYERYDVYESEKYNIESLLKNAEDYYMEFVIEKKLYINCYVDNWAELLAEIETNLEYSHISKEEIIKLSSENRAYESEGGRMLIREFLEIFDMEEYILEGLVESLYLEIQEYELNEVINEILEQLGDENKDVEEFIHENIVKFLKGIRIWKYKGCTISDRKDMDIIIENKKLLNRNELCSCGSGKRYKDCCAKNGNLINLF